MASGDQPFNHLKTFVGGFFILYKVSCLKIYVYIPHNNRHLPKKEEYEGKRLRAEKLSFLFLKVINQVFY